MFKNKTDRLNYGTLLMPPVGYELTKAVVTTYSLDLETLTAATIALGVREGTDSVVAETPVAMLRALQKVSDKVVVFCESGQIKLPGAKSPLVLLLEKMIVPVALKKEKDSFPSFHPKMWTIEYENAGKEKLYRFIILSRNLTFDRSWDVSFMMEGKKGNDDGHTTPLISFLEYLKKHISKDKKSLIDIVVSMQKELSNVKFTLDRKEFTDFSIMPIGIGDNGVDMTKDDLFKGYRVPDRTAKFHELTIMSPFLSSDTIKFLNSDTLSLTNTRRKLFTRRTELPKIKDVAGNFDVYVLKDTIIDGEEALPEGEVGETKPQDIHAKLYLRQKYPCSDLYLGSMNASNSGICRNVEMMIKLKAVNRYVNMNRLCEDFFAGEESDKCNPFEKVDLSNLPAADVDNSDDLINPLKHICRMERTCEVVGLNDGKYALKVKFSTDTYCLPANVRININPLMVVNASMPIEETMYFENLDILQLSEFFVITVKGEKESISRVITIPIKNIPCERDQYLIKDIIKDKKTFVEYVAMALGDDLLKLFGSERKEHAYSETEKHNRNVKMPALYERMLRIAYEDKRRLMEIEKIMGMINDDNIITPEFRKMYETFKSAVGL